MNNLVVTFAFVVYTLIWEGFVWGGGMWIILYKGWSPWWILFLLILSGAQWKPQSFRELISGVRT